MLSATRERLESDPQQLKQALKDWLQSLNWKAVAEEVAELVDKVLLPDLISLLQRLEVALDKVFESAEAATLSSSSIAPALALLEPYDDISMVAAPGLTGTEQWSALVQHCAKNAPNCFAILDAPAGADWQNTPPVPDEVVQNPDYAALYYPWIEVADAGGGENLTVPPSGHIAGVYARVDSERGVFKAPANESIYGALDLPVYVSDRQQQALNDGKFQNPENGINVNCIRRLNGGILIWGARTVDVDDNGQFQYVSTRRTFNYIRQSLEDGTQWAVFEPNTPALWGQITRNVTSFLTKLWQEGGLFGTTAAEAFYVKCDAETNPEDVRNAGQVVTEVGVAITKPAEFVVFKLGLTSGSATPSTSS
ncbi:phage tail sheath family protein [Microbulbifer taiwanensis]|uniref:phage tail sheath family protein n=1 Tax=Microbulbifer taiwanensis TaxID=986746 RepID=UPI00360A5025